MTDIKSESAILHTERKAATFLSLYSSNHRGNITPFITKPAYVIRDLSRLERPYYSATKMDDAQWSHAWVSSPFLAEQFTSEEELWTVVHGRFSLETAHALISYKLLL